MLRATLTHDKNNIEFAQENGQLLSTAIDGLREKINLKLTELCDIEKEAKNKDQPVAKKIKST